MRQKRVMPPPHPEYLRLGSDVYHPRMGTGEVVRRRFLATEWYAGVRWDDHPGCVGEVPASTLVPLVID